jgi:hypothetical protein
MSVQHVQIHMSLGMMEFTTIAPATDANGSIDRIAWNATADLHGTVKAALRRMMHDVGLLVVSCDKDGVTSEGWHRYRVLTGANRTISVCARWTDKTHVEL